MYGDRLLDGGPLLSATGCKSYEYASWDSMIQYIHLRGKTYMLLLLFVVYTIADTLVLAFDFFFII